MSKLTRRGVMALGGALSLAGVAKAETASIERWGLYEITLDGPKTGNPFADVTLAAEFRNGAQTLRVPGFYDEDGIYKIRFSPETEGAWQWRTTSNTRALNDRTGTFTARPATGGNHGPVRVTPDGYHFAYADGTPFRQIGTTAYAWAQQSDALCAETLQTLKAASFNKIRMCVYANVKAEPIEPFAYSGAGPKDWNAARFNPAFFRRFEDRVAKLQALGIEADIILHHPYDKVHGYAEMARADDERYLRYMIARLGAYRNVWWSMANEFDLVKAKSEADWDHIGQFVAAEDPHQRLRSIHNCKAFFDNRKPWVTHSSIQNGMSVKDDTRAEIYRSIWMKPVVFDEICYEGKSDLRWGNLTGEEMVSRFWHGLIAGTYVGHGEVLTDKNLSPDGGWTGIGGRLLGTSIPRLAFLKTVMEAGPKPGVDPVDKWWDRHIGGQAGSYYLRYFGDQSPAEWPLDLPKQALAGGEQFRVDLIDTWNMTVTPVEGVFTMQKKDGYDFHDPARPSIALPGKLWMAVRITRV
ncbi:DUF5060 domain-containing protein [Asticcacaulis sp.]|uniref:DUF5060 domain-containing protein n=1 Tax=Asticcacaulis sp. TaxID=1872648 RepID=UPI002CD42E36|nr:DUF5060 domain-containing protein [Asticcacaulis sp.]HTM80594.1 DUF5060 domain-containing protein [Asticcacaulis sp.]